MSHPGGISHEVNTHIASKRHVQGMLKVSLDALTIEGQRYTIELAKKAVDIADGEHRTAVDVTDVEKAIVDTRTKQPVAAGLYSLASFLGGVGGAGLVSVLLAPETQYFQWIVWGSVALLVLGIVTTIVAFRKSR
jgi:hypothetical protein